MKSPNQQKTMGMIIMLFIFMASIIQLGDGEETLNVNIPRFGLIKDMKERVKVFTSTNYLLLPHIYRAFIYAGAFPEVLVNRSISDTCKYGLEEYYKALINKRAWAWKMYDSTGKQKAGIFLGATTWTGDFDECQRLVIERCNPPSQAACLNQNPIQPRYCSVHMTHAPWLPEVIKEIKLPFPVPLSPFIVDVCIPSNCSESDISEVVEQFLEIDNFGDNISVKSVRCYHRKSIAEDAPALISAIILCVVMGMVVMGTSYDIYRRRSKVRVKQGPEIHIGYSRETDEYGILKILVPARKRRRRRGTLSSSDAVDDAIKENIGNGEMRPIYTRMNSELENIPEGAEMNELSDTMITSTHTTDGATEVISDEESSAFNEATEGAPMTPTSESDTHSIRLAPRVNRQASIIEVRPHHKTKKLASSHNLFTDLLLSFSFRKNTRHILADPSADTLYSLNGVRVLSIAWIVLGNVYGIIYQNPDVVENDVAAVRMTQNWWMQLVINTTLAADSFFILSGTLGAYNFLKIKSREGKEKEKDWTKVVSIKEYLFSIVHRLVRIGPCYAVLLMLGTNLMPFLGRGPRWSYEIHGVEVCKKNWWSNVLFIQNFYDPDNMCLPHTYYLANDFQFFLFSPLVLIPLLIMPKVGLGLIGFFVVGQIVIVAALNQGINGNVLRMKVNDYWSLLYVKPYSRIGVYCIGMGLGYFLHSCDRQMKFRKVPLYLGWIATCLVMFILPYITYLENMEGGRAWTGTETALYEAFSRPAWALGLSWVIFACSTKQGGFVTKFLSWNFFLPLCRITYGVFLLHPILISVVIGSANNNIDLSIGQLLYVYIALFVCSYGLAFLLISCVECPFTTFESHIRLRYKDWKKARLMKKLQKL